MKIIGELKDVKEDDRLVVLTLNELEAILRVALHSGMKSNTRSAIMDTLRGMSERWTITFVKDFQESVRF